MKTEYVRIYKAVHTWTGIVCGMALFIAFYAGALAVFKEPIERWVSPPKAEALVPLADARQHVLDTLQANPKAARDFNLYLADTERTPARIDWRVREAGGDDHDESAFRHYRATLDLDGDVQVEEYEPSRLGSLIDNLHRVVGLPEDSDPNRWVMGVIASLYVLALVSGVVILIPTLVKDFFALRIGKNRKRMWLDAHNVVGIVSLPFHIVMALSAVVFAYHDGIYAIQDKFIHDGKWSASSQRGGSKPAENSRDFSALVSPKEMVKIAQALVPTFQPYQLQYRDLAGPRAQVRVWGKDGSEVAPRARGGFVAIDPYSGKVLNSDFMPGKQSTAGLVISSFFALHMASFGGAATQWIYFLLGMAGAWLFYSGNLLWVESRRKAARKEQASPPVQRRDTRIMASATVGVCLGCICGISLTIVGGKWLYGHVANLNAWHTALYYAAFLGAIAFSFWRGPARAAVVLLWLAAATTLAIPATSLVAIMLPSLGMWTHTSPATLGVDFTALVFAAAYAWMAVATQRRVASGSVDSVWSAAHSAKDTESERLVCQ